MVKRTGKHGVQRSKLGDAAVFVVVALTGYLLMTNVRVNRTTTVTSDTAQLVEQRVATVNGLQKDVNDLSSQINALNKITDSGSSDSSDDAGSGTVLPGVRGPGVSITLDDSPLWEQAVSDSGSAVNINDYVIHQQDIEAVVNALWHGGAEVMMIQDQRVLFNSAVICTGNILTLQGKKYSPPYTVSAIGNTDDMLAAIDKSKAISTYKQYVRAFGLGWKVETKNLEFPQAAVLQPLRYATVNHGNGTHYKSTGESGK